MNNAITKDLNYGLEKEKENLEIIKSVFDKSLQKVKDKYYCFDFSCDSCYVELKSRRCDSFQYKDTMVGKNKLDYASKMTRPVFFVFGFNDGLYYWKYNKEDLDNGNVEIRKGGRVDRGFDELKDYGFIKTEILIKV
jgi:hypothetical protein